jgi:hypothetical protein
MRVTINTFDILGWIEQYDGPLFHAAMMDPPLTNRGVCVIMNHGRNREEAEV